MGEVHVIDDSDPLSDGECGFGFFFDGGAGNASGTEAIVPAGAGSGLLTCESGKDIPINVSRTIPGTAPTVTFNATGCDDDWNSPFATNTSGVRYRAPLNGSIDSEAWECTGKNQTLQLHPKGVGDEERHESFQMNVNGPDLAFRVFYRVDVTYQRIKLQIP